MPRFPTPPRPRRPATRRSGGNPRSSRRHGIGHGSGRYGIGHGAGWYGNPGVSRKRRFAAATALPSLLFASILGIGGIIAWRDPYARPPALPVRRPPEWGLPVAGAALAAATTAGAFVVARGPGDSGNAAGPGSAGRFGGTGRAGGASGGANGASGAAGGFAGSRAVRTSAILGLSAAAVPGVMAVAFDIARRTWARRSRGVAGTVVVLGCALRGTEPSTLLRLRLEKGAEVSRRAATGAGAPDAVVAGRDAAAPDAGAAGPDAGAAGPGAAASPAPVVVCGGTGEDEIVAEAVVMARWLRARGILDVVEEADSTTTIENLANAEALVAKAPVIVVTSDFHVFRTRWLTRRRGLAGWRVEGAPTPTRYWSTSMLREFLALGTMWPLPGIALGIGFAAWGLSTID